MGLECVGTRAHVAPVPVDLRVRGGDGFVSKDSERAQPGGAGAGREGAQCSLGCCSQVLTRQKCILSWLRWHWGMVCTGPLSFLLPAGVSSQSLPLSSHGVLPLCVSVCRSPLFRGTPVYSRLTSSSPDHRQRLYLQ